MILGPFDNPGGENGGFSYQYPPEKEINPNVDYQGKEKTISWQPRLGNVYVPYNTSNYFDLETMLFPNQYVLAYAYTKVYSPYERRAKLRIGSDDGCKVWLNDKLVISHFIQRSPGALTDDDFAEVVLRKGWNKVLVKIEQRWGGWAFYLDFFALETTLYQAVHLEVSPLKDLVYDAYESKQILFDMFPAGNVARLVFCL